ncbi:hypothetical protein J4466_05875 [Candidatus Pacearchaeota archaeon]|nr:hypothetical protein [uncultured archaeon]AQS29321.1 hypothetical protein [uncultured archaeon]MBS3092917.1 hypothetical protein [Candidatus Pacearchaeota archaeon]
MAKKRVKKKVKNRAVKKTGSKLNYYSKPRKLSITDNLSERYKSKKTFYTILWFVIILTIIISILIFAYNNLSEIKKNLRLSPSPDFTGLPSGFTPKFGYWHKNPTSTSSPGSVSLWDADGNVYFSSNGIDFTEWQDTGPNSKTQAELPLDYIPSIGYRVGFPGAETVLLWSSSRTIYAWSYSTQKFIFISSGIIPGTPSGQLPGDFIPTAGYWHNMGGNAGIVSLFDSTRWYYSGSDNVFNSLNPVNFDLPAGTPKVAYYYEFSPTQKGVQLWYDTVNPGKVYKFNPPTNKFVLASPPNMPSTSPTAGYFDKIRDRIVLFYGSTAYESFDAATFTRIGAAACTPQCAGKVCGSDSCGGSCGTCTTTGTTCNGAGQCVPLSSCTPESDSAFCLRIEKECGMVSGADNCGVLRTVNSCGSCDLGVSCSNNICTRLLTSPLCTDSDILEGAYGYYTKGNVTYLQNTVNVTKNDSCLNSTALLEWSCDGDLGINITYTCPNGCSASFCSGTPQESCTDSDEGLIFGTYGSVEYSLNSVSEIKNDTCLDEIALKEYYCDDNGLIASRLYDCLSDQACSGGECVLIVDNNPDQENEDNPPPTPTESCTDGEETCDGNYYLLCANGRWLDPRRVDNKCGYNIEDTSSNAQSGNRSSSIFGNSSFWIYLTIFLIVIIIIAGIVIFVVIRKKKKQKRNEGFGNPGYQQNSYPRPPPSPPTTTLPQYSSPTTTSTTQYQGQTRTFEKQ